MPNINIDVDEDTLWKFRQIKLTLKAKNNMECLRKMIEIVRDEQKLPL